MSNPIISDIEHDQFIDSLRQYMKSDPKFKDYNFEASGLSSLMRILAAHGVQQGFLANMNFNEGFMKTAEKYDNVASRSSMMSYVPDSMRGASMRVRVVVNSDKDIGDNITMTRDAVFIGNNDGKPFFFSPDDDYISGPRLYNNQYIFENVKLIQGSWVSQTFKVEGDAIDTYELSAPNIDITTIFCRNRRNQNVAEYEEYVRYMSAFDLSPEAALYYLEVNHRGLYTMEFGDGVLSRKPDDLSTFLVQYMVTEGSAANDIARVAPTTAIAGVSNVFVEVQEPASGGSERESIESIKNRAPISFASGGLAVSSREYANLVKDLHPQADAISWGGEKNVPPKSGFVFVAVRPNNRDRLTDVEKEELAAYIEERNTGSIFAKIVDVNFFKLRMHVTLSWLSSSTNTTESKVKKLVTELIKKYSAEELESFGKEYDNGVMTSMVDNMLPEIKRPVIAVEYEREVVGNTLVPEALEAKFNKEIMKGSVVIDGFFEDDPDEHFEIKDVNGDLFLFKDGIQQSESQVLGAVDYEGGVVFLSPYQFTNIIHDDDIISMRARQAGIDQSVSVGQNNFLAVGEVTVEIRNDDR